MLSANGPKILILIKNFDFIMWFDHCAMLKILPISKGSLFCLLSMHKKSPIWSSILVSLGKIANFEVLSTLFGQDSESQKIIPIGNSLLQKEHKMLRRAWKSAILNIENGLFFCFVKNVFKISLTFWNVSLNVKRCSSMRHERIVNIPS